MHKQLSRVGPAQFFHGFQRTLKFSYRGEIFHVVRSVNIRKSNELLKAKQFVHEGPSKQLCKIRFLHVADLSAR
ncbi:hypothetical protein D1823_13675 [Ruegeria sp. AD91A]|nr:hypothetical protein D1823_13675 [Ruegeria sp. AD91A]